MSQRILKLKSRFEKWAAMLACFAMLSCVAGCGVVEKIFGKQDSPPPPASTVAPQGDAGTQGNVLQPNSESDYQWALQEFEAGNYAKALERFNGLTNRGPSEGSELIPYYQGRSLYYLGRYTEAIEHLSLFISRNPRSMQAQEARLSALIAQNILRRWRDTSTLAAEALQEEAYIGNKILIRLLWGEALIELGELAGARKVLRETKPMFATIPDGSLMGDVLAENKDTLAERALWLDSHLQARTCAADGPAKWSKEAKTRPLAEWFARRGACLHDVVDVAITSFTVLGPRWNRALTDTLLSAIESYLDAPQAAMAANSAPSLAIATEVGLPEMRKSLYQTLSSLEQANGKAPAVAHAPRPYHALIARIEQGLQKLSIEASRADKAL